MDPAVWKGVNFFLDEYVHVQKDDFVVIVYNSDTYKPAAWLAVSLNARQIAFERVWMIPLQDPEFSSRLDAALPRKGSFKGRLVLVTLELSTMSHDNIIRSAIVNFDTDKTMVFRVISACDELFSKTLHVSPSELTAFNTRILEECLDAKRLRIKTQSGSDIHIRLDSNKHRWVSNRGVWRPGNFVILPAGEVATFPAAIEGTFIADFAFNVNMMTQRDARLESCPVRVEIQDNKAVHYECDDLSIMRFLDECFSTYCAHIVGELGFGTNKLVTEPIELNSHINERRPGIHLGFGSSNQSPSVVGYNCDIHLDLIAKGGLVWIDDRVNPIDMDNIVPSQSEHPTRTRDEDASAGGLICDLEVDDCCGILTSNGIRLFEIPS